MQLSSCAVGFKLSAVLAVLATLAMSLLLPSQSTMLRARTTPSVEITGVQTS